MAHELPDDAARLEALMSVVMRSIYRQDPCDPLLEYSVPQLRMLRYLGAGARTASSLGDELGLSVSAITQMANRLEGAGLLSRADDPTDRRIKQLSLTERGVELLSRRRKRRVEQARDALELLTPARRRHLVEALESLVSAVGKQDDAQPLYLVAELEQRLPLPPAS